MEAIVVLGTGTDVGKTWVSCALAAQLRDAVGAGAVRALKPVESGLDAATQASDAAALAAAAGHAYVHPAHCFAEPLSPHQLARELGASLDVTQLAVWAIAHSSGARWLVLETAGGAFSPLSERGCNADLVPALRGRGVDVYPILVANNRLGVLHDVAACQRALAPLQTEAALIVLNSPSATQDQSARFNATELRLLQLKPVLEFPYAADPPPNLLQALALAVP